MGILSVDTINEMHQVLNQYAVTQNKISGEKQRMDTTVYETNIHYPTDSSLLWDSFRTVARLVRNLQSELPQLVPFPVSLFRPVHIFRLLSSERDDTISNLQR